MFDTIFHLIVNAYTEDNWSSQGELTDVQVRCWTCVHTHIPESHEVRLTKHSSLNFANLVLRNGQSKHSQA